MLPPGYSRILWKEYHTQRALWGTFLVATLLLQLTSFFFPSDMQIRQQGYVFYIGMVLSICYTVAGSAVLFATEREEETDRFLLQLAIRPFDLITGKFTFILISQFTFISCIFITATVITLAHSGWNASFIGPQYEQELIQFFSLSLLAFATTTLTSVLNRQVTLAVLWSMGLVLTLSTLQYLLLGPSSFANLKLTFDPVFSIVISLIILTATCVLGSNWARGTVPRFSFLFRGDWESLTAKVLTPLLKWGAMRASLPLRTFTVLLWKETRAALPTTLIGISLLLGLHAFSLRYADTEQFYTTIRLISASVFLGWVCLLGLLVYSGDNLHQRKRFYENHGVSPDLIWLAKQSAWGCCLFLLMTSGLLIVFSKELSPDSHPIFVPFGRSTPFPTMNQMSLVTTALLLCYTFGQLLSISFQKILLPGGILLISAFFILVSCILVFALDIPLWLSFGPLLVGYMAGTCFLLDGWIRGTQTWLRYTCQTLWAGMPVVVSICAICVWRVVEIPLVDPGFDWKAHERQMAEFDPEWTRQWERLVSAECAAGPIQSHDNPDTQALLQMISDQIAAGDPPNLDPQIWLNTNSSRRLRDNLLENQPNSAVDHEVRSIEEQWNELRAKYLLIEYLRTSSITETDALLWGYRLRQLNRRLQQWSQLSGQTPETLNHLLKFHTHLTDSLSNSIKNQYILSRQALEGRGWGKRLHDNIAGVTVLTNNFPYSWLPGERARAVRLLNHQAQFQLNHTLSQTSPTQLSDIRKWEYTTPLAAWSTSNITPTVQSDFSITRSAWEPNALARLEKYRLVHGQYPLRLEDVYTEDERTLFGISLWEYRYESHGLPGFLIVSSNQILSPGQPVLFRETPLRTSPGDLITAQDLEVMNTSPELTEVKRLIDEGKTLWPYTLDRNRSREGRNLNFNRRHGSFPAVLEAIKHPASLTDRIKIFHFSEYQMY